MSQLVPVGTQTGYRLAALFPFAVWLTVGVGQTAQAEQKSKRWAILIGVDDYIHLTKLKYCGNDVVALRDQFQASGFDDNHLFLLHDGAAKQYLPFKSNITKQLKLVLSLVEPGDLVIVTFSGHGTFIGGKSYLCPTDAQMDEPEETMVDVEEVYDLLKNSNATMKLFMIDACRSEPRRGGSKAPGDVKSSNARFAESLIPPRGIIQLSSCSPQEKSWEDEGFKHGVFMNFVLKGLNGAADSNGDKRIALTELYQYANDQTKTYVAKKFTDSQRPGLKGELDDQFEIATISATRELTNSIGMKLVLIPGGEFRMGSPASEKDRDDNEGPVHKVRITRPFYLGQYEVTKGQFKTFVDATSYRTDAERDDAGGFGYVASKKGFDKRAEFTWRSWGVNQSENSPVVNVSWIDAVAYCDWLSRNENKIYRLPTEAEWEYACRAGTESSYSFGSDERLIAQFENVADTEFRKFTSYSWGIPGSDGYGFTAPVGKYKPNGFGLYDMHGNVSEWCQDWYDRNYYARSPQDDPQGPTSGSDRVCRGGGWPDYPASCRSATRFIGEPSHRTHSIGFRVVQVQSDE